MYGAYLNEAQAMQAAGLREANALGLQGNAKQNYVDDYTAREFANYYGQNLRTANSDSMESGLSTRQNKFNESWNEKNNINDRPTAPVIPTNEKGETQMISAQEYLWRQQQNGAVRTASEQVTEQVSQERANSSTNESRAPEYTPPNVQTIVRVKKSDTGEGESTEGSSHDDTGAHPPVNTGTASAGIPIAGSSKDNPKAPK
jgi:preprotein translocase subunit SecD